MLNVPSQYRHYSHTIHSFTSHTNSSTIFIATFRSPYKYYSTQPYPKSRPRRHLQPRLVSPLPSITAQPSTAWPPCRPSPGHLSVYRLAVLSSTAWTPCHLPPGRLVVHHLAALSSTDWPPCYPPPGRLAVHRLAVLPSTTWLPFRPPPPTTPAVS